MRSKLLLYFLNLIKLLFIFFKYRINRQNEVIRNAERTVYETEELGVEITNELLKNREKIQGVRAKVICFNINSINFLLY